jgi:hypothetical protein
VSHITRRWRRRTALALAAASLLIIAAPAANAAQVPAPAANVAQVPFEPITFNRIPLPTDLKQTGDPAFTADGKHLLFRGKRSSDAEYELWISDLKGKDIRCITCSGPAVPDVNYANPFPDGKRIFLAFRGVIECAPSVVRCNTYQFLPYDLSAANPPGGVIQPGGAANQPQQVLSQGAAPRFAPDGVHIGYSDVRSDGVQQMVVAKLVRQSDKYVVEDPKVINPAGPSSATDTDPDAWSRSSGLFEFKTFTRGGRAATYVEVGGAHAGNPDIWEVDLKTGQRTRLTSHPDWDEDMASSPDGNSLVAWSNRQIHLIDGLGGLLPHRSFIDAPVIGAEAGLLINTANNIACGGVMWLLPGDGDHGGMVGQPIVAPDAHMHDNVVGYPIWSPDGTKLAMYALKDGAGLFTSENPGYLVVAELVARKPTKPLPVVSSDVGDWAPAPADWHPVFGFNGTVTLNGPGGGTAEVTYGGYFGALGGTYSETFTDWSEDGKSFLNGTRTITVTGIGLGNVRDVAKLTLTGEHTGSLDKDLHMVRSSDPNVGVDYSGGSKVTYDGTTVTGPPSWLKTKGSCPERLPRMPQMEATATRVGKDRYVIKVTASQGEMGPNEAMVDTRPVTHASVQTRGADAVTNDDGLAVIKVRGNPHRPTKVTITAGETLAPTTVMIPAAK